MPKKPWPIIILSVLYFLEPLIKIFFYSFYWQRPVSYLMTAASLHSPYTAFMYFLAFPLAGIAIFAVKKWSLPVFGLLHVLTLIGHLNNHHLAPQHFPISLIVTISLLNFLVVSYFLIPAVRLVYFYPKFRWWESKPRYRVNWEMTVSQKGKTFEGTTLNLSEGGLFFYCKTPSLKPGKLLSVAFEYEGQKFHFFGRIVHQFSNAGSHRYGIKFASMQKKNQEKLVACLSKMAELHPEIQPIKHDVPSFNHWAKTALTTGKGIVPSLRKPTDSEAEKPVRKAA